MSLNDIYIELYKTKINYQSTYTLCKLMFYMFQFQDRFWK